MNLIRTNLFTFAGLCVFCLSSCAVFESSPEGSDSDERTGLLQKAQLPKEKIIILGRAIPHVDFDLPVRAHSRVEKWVDYFANGRGRRTFEKYLERSEYFIPYLEQVLEANQMPRDLVYLAMIESGFNLRARSNKAAVGPWQFIAPTARRYGLKVNWWIDERKHIAKSTLAAINYLKDLHEMFDSWELAASAYNAGEAKVRRAIERYHTRDFWSLSRQQYLRAETRNYIPKIFAAAIIDKNREHFGFKTNYREQRKLASLSDIPNSGPHPESSQSSGESVAEIIDQVQPQPLGEYARLIQMDFAEVGIPYLNLGGEPEAEPFVEFEFDQQVDLKTVAHAAGLTYRELKRLNPEILRWCTPPFEKNFKLMLPESSAEQFRLEFNHPDFRRKIGFQVYRVRRGDTLSRIARRFGISMQGISDLNRIYKKSFLREGRKLKIPIPQDRSRSLASLGLKQIRYSKKLQVSQSSSRQRLTPDQRRKAIKKGR